MTFDRRLICSSHAITWHLSSVNFSHFNLLLCNYLDTFNQALHEWYLEGPQQKFLISLWSDKKHGQFRHFCFWLANIQRKSFSVKLLCQLEPNFTGMMFKSPLQNFLISFWSEKKNCPPHAILVSDRSINKNNLLLLKLL